MRASEAITAVLAGVLLVFVMGTTARADTRAILVRKFPLPIPVTEAAVGELDGKVYVIGGSAQTGAGPQPSAQNLLYDPETDRWQERAPLPQALTHISAASLAGRLYAIGVFARDVHLDPVSEMFIYDPKANQWSELRGFSSPPGSLGAAAVDGKIHIFGGRKSDQVVKVGFATTSQAPQPLQGLGAVATHEIYDPSTGQWSLGKPLPGPARDDLAVAVVDGEVHVLGGRRNDSDLTERHDVYDPKTDTWRSAAPPPAARSAGTVTVLYGLLLYAGGACKAGGKPAASDTIDQISAYDPRADRWSRLSQLPGGRHGLGAATVREVGYFVGGSPVCGWGASRDVFALTVDPLQNFYGNTLTVVGPEGTTRLRYKPDHTFTAVDEKGSRISGTWEQSGDELCSYVTTPVPKPRHCGDNSAFHRVGDHWEGTRPNGAAVHISLGAN